MKKLAGVLCVSIAALVVGAGPAAAQGYPTKPVRLVVGFGAGGVADITARIVAQKLSEALGQQVIVDNRPSAGGIVAAETVAKAEPDGHTLLLLSNGNAVSVSLFKSLPYDTVADFAPVSTLGFFDLVLVANGDSTLNSVQDLISVAKAHPEKFNIGTINIGSTQHLAAELFRSMAGLSVATVPFKGTPAVVTALKSNDVQVAFEILAPVIAQIKGGSLKALAVTSDRRFSGLPNVPTVMESGLPNYQVASWNAIAVPAKTPRAIVERLNKEITAILAEPEVQRRFLDLGVNARASSPDGLKALLVREIAKWREVSDKARIEKQ